MIASCVVFSLGVGVSGLTHMRSSDALALTSQLQLSSSWAAFVFGRVVAGLGVGLISCLSPMYQSETSPAAWRGLVIGLYQWSITIGILLAAIVNNSMATKTDDSGWRIVIALQFVWAGILIAGMFWLPETPRHLALKGKDEAAKASLRRITALDSDDLETEYQILLEGLSAEAALGTSSYKDLFTGGPERMWMRTLTGTLIQAMQQLTGINFIFYYGTTFFKQSGISDPFVISIVTNVVNVVMTLPGIFSIDRAGRRPMLLFGAIGMCVCEYIVAGVGMAVGSDNLAAQRVLIAFVCIYIAFFASTWGPIPWCVCAEVFPSRLRAKGMSLSVASNWLWNFGIGYATPYLVNASTPEVKTAGLGVKVFLIWGSTCLACIAFTYLLVAETKGLTLEEVDELYRNSSIVRSNAYRKKLLAAHADHQQDVHARIAETHGQDAIQTATEDEIKEDIMHVSKV
jgi:sugar porter (SP) family MFS transporter